MEQVLFIVIQHHQICAQDCLINDQKDDDYDDDHQGSLSCHRRPGAHAVRRHHGVSCRQVGFDGDGDENDNYDDDGDGDTDVGGSLTRQKHLDDKVTMITIMMAIAKS